MVRTGTAVSERASWGVGGVVAQGAVWQARKRGEWLGGLRETEH